MTNAKRTRKTNANANAAANDNHPQKYGPIGDLVAAIAQASENGTVFINTVCADLVPEEETRTLAERMNSVIQKCSIKQRAWLVAGGLLLFLYDRRGESLFWIGASDLNNEADAYEFWEMFAKGTKCRFHPEIVVFLSKQAIADSRS